MKIVFIVTRKNFYQAYGPLIDEALRLGLAVECWHDAGQPRQGRKGYQFPDTEEVPAFSHGRPRISCFNGPAELASLLSAEGVCLVVSLHNAAYFLKEIPKPAGITWIGLQHMLDLFLNGDLQAACSSDWLAVYSPWWVDWACRYFKSRGELAGSEQERDFRQRCISTGFPLLAHRRRIDPQAVRTRWGIPGNVPVVVYLPFPGAVNPESFWASKIFLGGSRIAQAAQALAAGEGRYWKDIYQGWDERHLVRALRRFCDRNGAFLLVKSRQKTPIPVYVRSAADRCLYDETYYPATIMEAMSIASLSVGYYSAAVAESVACGVPHLCLTFKPRDYYGWDPERLARFKLFFNDEPGGMFSFAGASTAWPVAQAIQRLPQTGLGAFAADPRAQQDYRGKFLGGEFSGQALFDALKIQAGSQYAPAG